MNESHARWLGWRAEAAMAVDASIPVMHSGWCALMALRSAAVGDLTGTYRWAGHAYAALMDGVTK